MKKFISINWFLSDSGQRMLEEFQQRLAEKEKRYKSISINFDHKTLDWGTYW